MSTPDYNPPTVPFYVARRGETVRDTARRMCGPSVFVDLSAPSFPDEVARVSTTRSGPWFPVRPSAAPTDVRAEETVDGLDAPAAR